jgi:prepilin-type N-terminal cleavage/methylation domain-containing protein
MPTDSFDVAKKKKGFTLLEIIVTLTLAAVLVSIGGVLMSGWSQAAFKEEAIVTMRKIRTAERLYYTEMAEYADISDADGWTAIGINYLELDRKYFSHECYNVNANLGNISCNAASSNAAGKNKVSGISAFTMNINTGTVT